MKLSIFSAITMLIASISIFSGCKQQVPKIGVLVHTSENENWQIKKDYLLESLNNKGVEVLVNVADSNPENQVQHAQEMLEKGVKVLIIVPSNHDASAKIVELAHKENVKVIAFDRLIHDCQLDYYVSTNTFDIGELQASYLTSLNPSGNYALICGSKDDDNSMKLFNGQMNVLQPYMEKGNIQVVYSEFTENWSAAQGALHTNQILNQNQEITAIIAGNDAIAEGVITTLRERGLEGKVMVAGKDAELYNIRAIKNGEQTCTIFRPFKEMAAITTRIAVSIASEKQFNMSFSNESNGKTLVKSVLLTSSLVNNQNIDVTVGTSGYYTMAQLNQ